ncbi:MAG TPA: DUF1573 domain-containing protein [Anaerolineae bacterium]|nr:DUF1573 domain-containing protein [Anaerolineae bacterium]
MNSKTIAIVVVTAVLLGLAAVAGYAALPQAPGAIELSATEFDFGTVPNTGPVSRAFQVRNAGSGPLRIDGASTSCGCTTAEITAGELAPGASTPLTVTYDPLAHDGALGEFLRIVYVRSDDPETPEATLTIRVRVVEP